MTISSILADSDVGDHMDGFGGFGWTMMGLWLVVALVGLSILIWTVNRSTQASTVDRDLPAEPDAVQVLRVRFAEGKIDEDEYRTRLAALEVGE